MSELRHHGRPGRVPETYHLTRVLYIAGSLSQVLSQNVSQQQHKDIVQVR